MSPPLTVAAIARALAAGECSALEIADGCLRRIEETDAAIKAWSRLCADRARHEAAASDARRARGAARGPLDGVPFGVKDIIDTEGVETTCSADLLAGNVPQTDATTVARLRAAGAVMLGKVNTQPFAYGVTTPPTRNPWSLDHVPGGSSGGSGAAVAARQVPFALGTDTGGSIRIPAALNGVTGLRPTFGRVPKDRTAVVGYSLDTVGPLCLTAEDAGFVLNVIAGYTPDDPSAARVPPTDFTADLSEAGDPRPLQGLRVGLMGGYFTSRFPDVTEAVHAAAAVLEQLGASVRDIPAPTVDGIAPHVPGFAVRMPEAAAWHAGRIRRQEADYPPITVRLIRPGDFILATDYINGRRYRRRYGAVMRRLYNDFDVTITPTVPAPAVRQGETHYHSPDGFEEELVFGTIRCTFPFSLTGQPVLTVPCGFTANALPVGLQIAGRPWAETAILRVGHAFQQATDWHDRRPPAGAVLD